LAKKEKKKGVWGEKKGSTPGPENVEKVSPGGLFKKVVSALPG